MRTVIVFLLVPIVACAFLAYSVYQDRLNDRGNVELTHAIEKFKRNQSGWPHDASSLEPYVDEPDAIRSMSPTFLPLSNNEAYMEENVWSMLSAKRESFRVTVSPSGACSINPTARL
jgi:hypothetical protein